MASKVKLICEEKISPIINNLGYDVVEVEYTKKSDGMNLTFYIDNEKGIDIKDCEIVSKAIDDVLEELDPTEGQPYILNVSSPGIDRPLKTDKDLQRNLEKEISITLFSKVDGCKNFDGILKSFDENSITIKLIANKKNKKLTNEQTISLEKTKIAHIVPIIKF